MKTIRFFSLLSVAAVLLISCKKDDSHQYMNSATIIGEDKRLCVCCGGYEMVIDNVPTPNGGNFF